MEPTYKQMMPAPGWRCFHGLMKNGKVKIEELPVVGWAIVETEDITTADIDITHVDLLVVDGERVSGAILLARYSHDQVYAILVPGKELDKKDLQNKVRRKYALYHKELEEVPTEFFDDDWQTEEA